MRSDSVDHWIRGRGGQPAACKSHVFKNTYISHGMVFTIGIFDPTPRMDEDVHVSHSTTIRPPGNTLRMTPESRVRRQDWSWTGGGRIDQSASCQQSTVHKRTGRKVQEATSHRIIISDARSDSIAFDITSAPVAR